MRTLCFFGHAGGGQITRYDKMAHALKKHQSVLIHLIVAESTQSIEINNAVHFDSTVNVLPDYSEIERELSDYRSLLANVAMIEKQLGQKFIHQDLLMDRFLRGGPNPRIRQGRFPIIWTDARAKAFIVVVYRKLQDVLGRLRPELVYQEVNSAVYRLSWRICNSLGIPAGHFASSRLWSDRMYLEMGLGLFWSESRGCLKNLLETDPDAETVSEDAKIKLAQIERGDFTPGYMRQYHSESTYSLFVNFKMFASRVSANIKEWRAVKTQSYDINPRQMPSRLLSPMGRLTTYLDARASSKEYYQGLQAHELIKVSKLGSFVFYPLHTQPELTVEEMSFYYQDQVATIRAIAAALPADILLVVKEHLPMLGSRPRSFYEELFRMPGVIVVDHSVKANMLYRKAIATIVLTGTAGMEAILVGKPAIVLGDVFFNRFPGAMHVRHIRELDTVFSDLSVLVPATRKERLLIVEAMWRKSSAISIPPSFGGSVVTADDGRLLFVALGLRPITRSDRLSVVEKHA